MARPTFRLDPGDVTTPGDGQTLYVHAFRLKRPIKGPLTIIETIRDEKALKRVGLARREFRSPDQRHRLIRYGDLPQRLTHPAKATTRGTFVCANPVTNYCPLVEIEELEHELR